MTRISQSFLICLAALTVPATLSGQHQHLYESTVTAGAHAVGVLTHVTPAMLGKDRTEGYLTQPAIFLAASTGRGRLQFMGVLNLEGLTLKRGELNHSVWGEGYVDRRHPHTYL